MGREGRKARREVERRKRRLEKKLKNVNLPVFFENETVTGSANFPLVESFERAIDLKGIIEEEFSQEKRHNSKPRT